MAHQLQVTGSASLAFMGGSGNVITGADNLGDLFKITIGSNLTLTGGVLSATGGGTGSVTSVGLTTSADALTITNSPITTSGNIGINFAGNTTQYVRGDGSLATFPTTSQASKLITEVYNETGATLTKGTIVYINGGHGNLPTVTKAKANSDATSAQTYGVVQANITNNNNGNVVVIGSLIDLDTQAYANGTQLYLSGTTAGAWTDVKPQAPIHLVYVGIVTRSHPTQGVVEVKIQNGYELDELHDVKIVDVANTDGIFYNSSTSLWENKTIAEVLGYTPANDASVVKLTGNQTIAGVKTFSSESKFNGGITLTGGDIVLKSGDFNTTLNTDTLSESRSILFPDNSGTVALLTDIDYPVLSVFGRTGDVVAVSGDYDTDMVDEGTTNLYYTNARARAALSANTGSALTYNSTTGRFTLVAAESGVSGYLTGTDWDTFNGKQNSLGTGTTSEFLRGDLVWATPPTPALEDLTDVGITSPTNGQLLRYQVGTWVNWTPNYVSATYFSATAPLSYSSGTGVFSISQATTSTNGYLSSTDWNTFNNKQDALTNPVTGTGASGYIAKWNTASTITNSLIYEASSKVGINTTNMVSLFDVTKNALGVTVVDTSGITLKNETEAITGNQQISPALHFKSNGWNNLATASQSADWINYSLPIQGNAVTSNLTWASSINGAAYTTRFTLSSAGNGTFTGTLAASNLSGTNTGDVTIGTANGLSLSGQAISLALASTSTTGALSSTDWNTFNGKQAQINGTGFVKASGTTISYDNSTYLTTTSAASTYVPYTGATANVDLGSRTLSTSLLYVPPVTTLASGATIRTYNYSDSNWGFSTTAGAGAGSDQYHVRVHGYGNGGYLRQFQVINASASNTVHFAVNFDGTGAIFSSGLGLGGNMPTADRQFYISGSSFTTGTNQYQAVLNTTFVNAATNIFGLYLNNNSNVNVTNSYSLYIPATGGSGTITNKWAIAQVGASDNNYFAGKILVNTTTDAGYLLDVNGWSRVKGSLVVGDTSAIGLFSVTPNSIGTRKVVLYSGADNNYQFYGFGVESSTLVYSTYTTGDDHVFFAGTSSTTRNELARIKGTGAATFSSSVTTNGSITTSISSNSGSGSSYPLNSISNTLATQGDGSSTFNFAGLLVQSGNGAVQFYHSTSYASGTWEPQALLNVATNHPLIIRTNNTERLRVTNSGNVGIGTTSPIMQLHSSKAGGNGIFVSNTTNNTGGYLYASTYTFQLQATDSTNSSVGTLTIQPFGGNVLIGTSTDNGTKLQVNGGAWVNGNVNANAAYLTGTNYDFPNAVVMANDTNWTYGIAHPGSEYWMQVKYYGVGDDTRGFRVYNVGAGGAIDFRVNGLGNGIFRGNVTATAFFESSDKRIKKELADNPTINKIQEIKPKLYIKNGKEELGYYAQELQDILPSAVSEGKDGFLSLAYSQVHTAKIAQLESKIEELEALIKNLIK